MVPVLLALLGIVLLFGHLGTTTSIVVSFETLAVCAYQIYRARRGKDAARPVSNLLSLFPGHLLLLLAVSTLDRPDGLAWLWTIVPAATIVYDLIGFRSWFRPRTRVSILIGLYAIIWIDLFALLERTIAIKRQFGRTEEIIIAVALGVAGSLFVALGAYRHWVAFKE